MTPNTTGSRTEADDAAQRIRTDPGFRLEPAAVVARRSRAGFIAGAVIAVALALAIAKPWAPPGTRDAAQPSGEIAAASAGSSPPASTVPRAEGSTRPARPADSDRVLRVADWPRLMGDLDHLGGQPIVSDRDLVGAKSAAAGAGTCGGSARIGPFDELLAIATAPGERVAAVRLFAIDSISRPDIPTRIADDRLGPIDYRSHDGLTVVRLPSGGIAPRRYALIADATGAAGREQRTYTICVG